MTTKASKESVLGQTKQGATKTHVSPLGLQGVANFHTEPRNLVTRSKGTVHSRGESLSSFMNTVMLRKVSLGFSLGMNIPSN